LLKDSKKLTPKKPKAPHSRWLGFVSKFRTPINRMPRIGWHAVEADRVVVAAMLGALLAGLMAMPAQALKLAAPKLDRIVVVWLDVIGNACGCDLAFPQTPLAQRLRAQLSSCAAMP
jgi:hypothetical protein